MFIKEDRWQYLSVEEINLLSDMNLQSSYKKKIRKTVKFIINPLYMNALKQGFNDVDFLKEVTVHGMIEKLKAFYESRGIDRDERIKILLESRKK